MDKLQNLITKVHATAVVNYIDKLTCPTEQKLQIINEFISDEKIAGQL